MPRIAVLLLFAGLCLLSSHADAMAVRRFQELDAASADRPETIPQLDMYLRGVYEGVVAINTDLEKLERKPLFCMQKSMTLAPVNIREMIKKRAARLKKNLSSTEFEAMLDSDMALFVLDGFRDGYPCS